MERRLVISEPLLEQASEVQFERRALQVSKRNPLFSIIVNGFAVATNQNRSGCFLSSSRVSDDESVRQQKQSPLFARVAAIRRAVRLR